MRSTACALVFAVAVLVVACRSAPKAEAPLSNRAAPPAKVEIEVEPKLREMLALGVPLNLELRVDHTPVGNCHLAFDLWEETYRVSMSKTVQQHADLMAALRSCVDFGRIAVESTVQVHELEQRPLYQPPTYPVF
jgi:hypothetical protein